MASFFISAAADEHFLQTNITMSHNAIMQTLSEHLPDTLLHAMHFYRFPSIGGDEGIPGLLDHLSALLLRSGIV